MGGITAKTRCQRVQLGVLEYSDSFVNVGCRKVYRILGVVAAEDDKL